MKYSKINHLIKSKLFENRSINEIRTNFTSGETFVSSFLKAKKANGSATEKNSLKTLDSYGNELSKREDLIDFSLFGINEKQTVSSVYQRAASKLKWCHFFYFLSKNDKVTNILEIGTNLGVSGQYFIAALGNNNIKNSNFITFEGVPDLCKIANERFLKISEDKNCNYKIIQGLYKDTLHEVDDLNIKFDIVFIDGNHKYKPTIEYYEYLLNHSNNNAVFIFDDINWSNEMKQAWQYILNTNYSYSIDFFKTGIIVIEKDNNLKKNYNLFLTL
ncbi:class I SAM-dependent methyltransferase [Flavobacterium dauae]|uniref:O-methyltransferase n=1 Tax=Flavobacterium dauae TaxID=1563479 RepID=UPI00101B2408|nr:class I SAM-dependent methyltransferase [Flavobacterium dauae]WLD23921.1 class I SAM-dependent methyltransferase [Flavobacterium dauae]